jgi:hypothetical protein
LEAALAKIQATFKAARIAAAVGYEPEDRTPEAYRTEVETYLKAARDWAVHRQIMMAIRDGVGRLQPVVSNPTERNFTNILVEVQIEVQVDAPVMVIDVDDAGDTRSEPGPPNRPRRWGPRPRDWHIDLASLSMPRRTVARLRTVPRVNKVSIEQGPPCRMRWQIGHLPPRGRADLAPVSVLVRPQHAGQTLTARWTATARDANGVASGALPIAIDTTLAMITPVPEQQAEPDQEEG